jgi:hypothetical protein
MYQKYSTWGIPKENHDFEAFKNRIN